MLRSEECKNLGLPKTEEEETKQVETLSPTRKRKAIDLKGELQQSVRDGRLDILKAGRAIQSAYENGQSSIPEDIDSFISQQLTDPPSPQMPEAMTQSDFKALAFGSTLVSMLSFELAKHNQSLITHPQLTPEDINCLTDNPSLVQRKHKFPSFPPYSGSEINVLKLNLCDPKTPVHVRLSNYLFQLLQDACSNQKHIQNHWLLPEERVFRYGHQIPFDIELFENLKDTFLQFFQLDHPALDDDYSEVFGKLPFLKNCTTEAEKILKFQQMAEAKKRFNNGLFRARLKEALKELRLGTLVIPKGSVRGFFVKRKRQSKKEISDEVAEDEEEEENPDGREEK